MSVLQIKIENESESEGDDDTKMNIKNEIATDTKIKTENCHEVWIKEEPADQNTRTKFDNIDPYADNLDEALASHNDDTGKNDHDSESNVKQLIKNNFVTENSLLALEKETKIKSLKDEPQGQGWFKQLPYNKSFMHRGADCSDYNHHCDHCNRKFETQDNLRKHMEYSTLHEHVDNKIVSCDECYSSFTKSSSLQKHILQSHTTPREPEASKNNIINKVYQNNAISGKITAKWTGKKSVLKNIFGRESLKTNEDKYVKVKDKYVGVVERDFRQKFKYFQEPKQPNEIAEPPQMETNKVTRPFKCEKCKTNYKTDEDLKKHLEYSMVHKEEQLESTI